MKRTLLPIFTALLLCTAVNANAQHPAERNTVTINASATRTVEPNKFEIQIILSEEPSKGRTTIASMQNTLASVLKNAGIDANEALVIVSQSSTTAKRKDVYQYVNYMLTVTTPKEMKDFFAEMDEQKLSEATLVRTSNTDIVEISTEVRQEAMQKARRAAQELAAAISQQIGDAISIEAYINDNEVSNYVGGRIMYAAKSADSNSARLPENLGVEDVQVSQSVVVEFELLPAKDKE